MMEQKSVFKKYKWSIYAGLMIICFLVGVQVWRIAHPGHKTLTLQGAGTKYRPVLAYVAGDPITSEELEWELSLHTKSTEGNGLQEKVLNKNLEESLTSLREKLLGSIIEREVLYKMLLRDKTFDTTDSSRYSSCLKEWQQVVSEFPDELNKTSQDRLKDRFCQKSLILQYLNEEIYPRIKITDAEVQKFLKDNPKILETPERIVLRQIVSPSEKASRQAAVGLTRANFAQKAKELSITPEAVNGGKLGPFARDEMPHFFNVAFQMRKGQIQGMVKSDYGFHIFLLEEKIPRKKLSLTEGVSVAKEALLKVKKEEAFAQWVDASLNVIPIETVKNEL